jgi:8-oxo-dGTP pyrophosphatase MutT (NUDIX family)
MSDCREQLWSLLSRYRAHDAEEAAMVSQLRRFVDEHPDCFERSLKIGHITGSAWIVDPTRLYALLTHHWKLHKWMQLGGHADGDPDVLRVALREGQEESGLSEIRPLSADIFDIDVHLIPARPGDAEHYHYDVRFAMEASREATLVANFESRELAWVPISRISEWTVERSITRMVEKTAQLGRLARP